MILAERYKTPADLPREIAVFPLQGAILLPRSALPLNVFEPRYLQMLDDVISGSRILGIIQPAVSDSPSESPLGKSTSLRTIGCAGRVTGYEELADGRLTVIVTGVCRFKVESELATTTPYRQMLVSYAPFAHDLTPGSGEDEIDREELLEALRTYVEAKRLQADWKSIEKTGTEVLVNALSLTSPYGPEEKQALLETPTLKERVKALLALSKMEIAAGAAGESVRRRLQ